MSGVNAIQNASPLHGGLEIPVGLTPCLFFEAEILDEACMIEGECAKSRQRTEVKPTTPEV